MNNLETNIIQCNLAQYIEVHCINIFNKMQTSDRKVYSVLHL